MKKPRKIAIVLGSDSDLAQCWAGLAFIRHLIAKGLVELFCDVIFCYSIHRHHDKVTELALRMIANEVEAAIVAAGWANHLTGTLGAIICNQHKSPLPRVVGVAFEDLNNAMNTVASLLSISQVPNTQVIFKDPNTGRQFLGRDGFLQACQLACVGDLGENQIQEIKPPVEITLNLALASAQEKHVKLYGYSPNESIVSQIY